MTIPDLILTANKNLLTNKVRTILTILAIFVGSVALAFTAGINNGARTFISDQTNQVKADGILQVQPTSGSVEAQLGNAFQSSDNLTEYKEDDVSINPIDIPKVTQEDIVKFKSEFKDLKEVIPYYNVTPTYIQSDSASTKYKMSTSSLNVENIVYNIEYGRAAKSQNEITISQKTRNTLGYKESKNAIDKKIILTYLSSEGVEIKKSLNIVGVLEKSLINNDLNLVTPEYDKVVNDEINKNNPEIKNKYYFVFLVFNKDISSERLDEVKTRLTEIKFKGETFIESNKILFQIIDTITNVLYAFSAIVLLASVFGVINTLLMSILERTKEIGLMRSLGMSQKGVFTIFSLEAISLGFWGSFIACLLVFLLSFPLNYYASQNWLKDFNGYSLINLPIISTLQIIAGVMFITFIAGVLPSIKASKQNPITALRSE
jgi:putative ABC transport system permease protein